MDAVAVVIYANIWHAPEEGAANLKILAVLIFVLLAAGAAVHLVFHRKPYGTIPADGLYVDIPPALRGGPWRILKRAGVIRNSFAFELYARRHRSGRWRRAIPVRTSGSRQGSFRKLANGEVYQQPFTVREPF